MNDSKETTMYQFNSKDELLNFINENIIDTNEVAAILGCSRQNISQLVKSESIKPIKTIKATTSLYFKPDILEYLNKRGHKKERN